MILKFKLTVTTLFPSPLIGELSGPVLVLIVVLRGPHPLRGSHIDPVKPIG